jgi:hypothetical protein
MVIFPVALHEGGLKVGTDGGKERAEGLMRTFCQHFSAILCYKHQMDV